MEYLKSKKINDYYVGIHFRNTDRSNDINKFINSVKIYKNKIIYLATDDYTALEQFKKKLPNFIFELDLDKLVNNPETESHKLMEFCDLPWDKKCLEFYKRKDLISKTTSNIQIRKAISKGSIKKYLPYGQFLSKYKDKYNWFY